MVNPSDYRILYIEDDPALGEMFTLVMSEKGYAVDVALTGEDGLAMHAGAPCDLVVVDYQLPGISGIEVMRKLLIADRDLPVIMVTGQGNERLAVEALKLGAYDYVTKDGEGLFLKLIPSIIQSALRWEASARRSKDAEQSLRISEQRLRDYAELGSDWYWEMDSGFRYTHFYASASKLGMDPPFGGGVVGKTRTEVYAGMVPRFSPEGLARYEAVNELIAARSSFREFETEWIREDGETRYVSISGKPLFGGDGTFLGYRGAGSDITLRREAKQTLARARDELEERVRERTEELVAAKDEAEKANHAKSNFLSTMSHEIRTPMHGVIGMVDLLQMTNLDDRQQRMTDIIQESIHSLLTIINDILDYSKIEADRLETEAIPLSLQSLAESVVEISRPAAERNGGRVLLDTSPALPKTVMTDPGRLRQILVNLMGNAVKFGGGKGGKAIVNLHVDFRPATDGGPGHAVFKVTDNGIGMSMAQIGDMFQPFTQADSSTTREYGGSGLGLGICKRLTDLLDGNISVVSEPNRGSTFTVTIPMIAEPAIESDDWDDVAGLRVLLRLADEDLAGIVQGNLEYAGALVTSLDQAVRPADYFAKAGQPGAGYDLVLLDENGAQAPGAQSDVRDLRSHPACANAGFVLFGTNPLSETGLQAPGVALLGSQPFRSKNLLHWMAALAGRAAPLVTSRRSNIPAQLLASDAPSGRVLVAEDQPINQEVIRFQLNTLGYECDITANGEQALVAWAEGDYWLVVTDFHMPVMDGFGLTRAIRDAEQEAGGSRERTPIIAVSADAMSDNAERGLAAGMDGFLAKPVDLAQLKAAIAPWANAQQRRDRQPRKAGFGHEGPKLPNGGPFDFTLLAQVMGSDDRGAHLAMIEAFWRSVADDGKKFTALTETGDAKGLRNAAHASKGAAASCGATALSKVLEGLQNAAGEVDWPRVYDLLEAHGLEMRRVEAYIKSTGAMAD